MSTPGRRHSPAVYRRRRLVVLVGVLLIIAAIVLLVLQPWRGSGTPDPARGGTPTTGGTTAASPSPSPSTSTKPGADKAPAPVTTTTAPVTKCVADVLQVAAKTDKDSYGANEQPKLSLSLTNGGSVDCTIDVGTATQSFVISSGNDVWWRSTDCQTAPASQVVTLQAGKTVSSAKPIVWDRTRSSTETCKDADRPRAAAGGASYRLKVAIGGVESRDSAQMILR